MGYYAAGDNMYGRGDYYKGDYYQGDFLGIGKALKTVGNIAFGAVKKAFYATPAGQVFKTATALIHPVLGGSHPNLPQPRGMSLALQGQQSGIVNIGPPGASQSGLINLETGVGGGGLPGAVMKGYHPNKSTYETRGGGTSRWPRELELHPKGSVLVRNRRMNVGNARALKRALRRAGGFARLARRVMTFTHPRAGRGHFKVRRRARK